MEDQMPAAALPGLYRAVLDTVARLERAGERDAALVFRRRALATYSGSWDERGRRGLEKIDRDARQHLASSPCAAAMAFETSPEPS